MKSMFAYSRVFSWLGMAVILVTQPVLRSETSLFEQVYCTKHAHFLAPADSPDHRKYAPSRFVDIQHLKLDITPDFKKRTVSGTTHITFKPIANPLDQLRLDAVELTFGEINASHAISGWHVSEDAVIIDFENAILPDEEAWINLEHSAEPSKGMYFRTPEMGYKDGETHLFTQGEPVEARHWFPSFDAPNEKFTTEITCRVPSGMEVLSNGHLASKESVPNTNLTAFTWLQDKPHVNYLISVVAGYFVKIEDRYKNIPMAFWTLPSEIEQAQNSFQDTKAMMAFFEEEIGVPYPWAKYDQICVNDFVAGGMENTSLTSLTDGTLFTSDTENLRSSQGLVAHELAHQWFGDLVTCKDWSHLWLNEGFATYYDALFEEHKNGRDAFLYQMYKNARGFAGRHSDETPIVHRAYDRPMEQFGYRAYPKGSWILHMLRSRLGEDLYRKCVQTYLERHAYGVVVTENLNAVIEELSGQSFDRFFDQYVFHGGHPDLSLSYSWDSKLKLAKVSVKQNQKIGDKVMLFEVPATIRFKTSEAVIDHPMTIREKAEDFYIPLPDAPEVVRFDPEYTLLAKVSFSKPTPLLLAQLKDESDVMGRVFAVKDLEKNKSQKSIEALKERLNNDPFYGVRLEAADALGGMHTPESLAALLESRDQDDARVRYAVQSAVARFYHPDAYAASKHVVESESNPMIVSRSLNAIGNYGNAEIPAVLLQFLNKASYRNRLTEAAISAMESQDDADYVMPILNTLMQRKQEFTTRGYSSALSTLAQLSRHLEDKSMVLSFITGHLQDPKNNIRLGAIRALAKLGDSRAIVKMNGWLSADPDSAEHKAARSTIDTLNRQNQPGDDLRNLRNKIQEMESSHQSLENQLADLKNKLEALAIPAESAKEGKKEESKED